MTNKTQDRVATPLLDAELTVREAGVLIRHAERTIEQTILDLKSKGLPVTDIGIKQTEVGWQLTLHCQIEPRDEA